MSWSQWPGGNLGQPGIVQPPVINPAPSVVNPSTNQYTPEQWAQMQHQNWQQWAQWQQQFQQWQQQYGAEYQKSMNAIAQATIPSQASVPFMPAPPLPTENKPPPPPDEPAGQPPQPSNASFGMNVPSQAPQPNYNAGPPPSHQNPKQGYDNKYQNYRNNAQPGAFPNQEMHNQQRIPRNQNYNNREQQGQNMNWQNQNRNQQGPARFNQQPHRGPQFENKSEFGAKRPLFNPNEIENIKRNKMDLNEGNNWGGNQPLHQQQKREEAQRMPPQPKPPVTPVKSNPEELSEAEKKFDKQFNDWEAQFQKWKQQNANHPDKEQYRQYEKKWETWRAQLLERREQMKRKRLGLTTPSPQQQSGPNKPDSEQPTKSITPNPLGGISNANIESTSSKLELGDKLEAGSHVLPPPNLNNQPLDFKKSGINVESSDEPKESDQESTKPGEGSNDFLKSTASDGIPGLDLVKDDGVDAHEEENKKSETTKPDLEAISRGINSILGDQKLLNMLSMVQNKSHAVTKIDSPKFSPTECNNPNNEYSNEGADDHFHFEKPSDLAENTHNQDGPNLQLGKNDYYQEEGSNNFGGPDNFDKPTFNRTQNFNRDSGNTNFANFNTNPSTFNRMSDQGGSNLSRDDFNNRNPTNKFNRGFDNFSEDQDEFDPQSDNYNDEEDDFGNFNRGPRGFDSSNCPPDSFGSGRGNFNRGPGNFNRGPANFNRAPDNFKREPDGFNREPDNFNRGPDNFNRGPDNFNRGPDNFNRGPSNFNRGVDSFNKGPDNFNRGLDKFSRGPNNFNQGPDIFNRGPDNCELDNFNRGTDNFRGHDNFNRDPSSIGRPDNFNRGPDNRNRGIDNFDRGSFNRGGGDNFNRGPRDFNRGPDKFTPENDNFNRGHDTGQFGGPENFNRGNDNFNRSRGPDDYVGGPDDFSGDSENFREPQDFNKDGNDFDEADEDDFHEDSDNYNRGDENFDNLDRGADNFNRGSNNFNAPTFNKGPDRNLNNDNRNFDNFNRRPSELDGGRRPSLPPRGDMKRELGEFGRPTNLNQEFSKFDRKLDDNYSRERDNFNNRGPPTQFNKFDERRPFGPTSNREPPNRGQEFPANNFNQNKQFNAQEDEFDANSWKNESTFADSRSNASGKNDDNDTNTLGPMQRNLNTDSKFDSLTSDSTNKPLCEKDEKLSDGDGMWRTFNVIDYAHKSLPDEPEVILEVFHTFDYRHKPLNRIPYPSRPKWLSDMVNKYPEFDVPNTRNLRSEFRKYPLKENTYNMHDDRDKIQYDDRNRRNVAERDKYSDRERTFVDDRKRKPYDDRERYCQDERDRSMKEFRADKGRGSYGRGEVYDEEIEETHEEVGKTHKFDEPKSRDTKPAFAKKRRFEDKDDSKNKDNSDSNSTSIVNIDNEQEIKSKVANKSNTTTTPSATKSNITSIEDILTPPGRYNRPPRIVIILRGPPGSGKSFLAKLIKDKEVENGGSAPRILCLDDYFMVEQEKEVEEDGRKTKVKEMVYEYEEEMEASYRQSLMKSFKKTITDGYFNFIIVDNINDKVKYFGEMWSFAKQNGFQVYICQMDLDVQNCTKRNVHGRSEAEIEKCVKGWEPTPSHHPVLDATGLIQSGSIPEVEMEEINSPSSDPMSEEERLISSKWDTFDYSIDNLAKLDGTNKPLRTSRTMEDYLQLGDDWIQPVSTKPGQKRVRWADLEERKEQEKMRAIGFVVGQTNWNRMMDPTMGGSALTQTKYIERY